MKSVKAYLNLLAFRLSRASKPTTVDHYPVVGFVDPTSLCNLRCPACPTGTQAGLRSAVSLDLGLFKAFIDDVGDYLFKLYMHNLGEPLLHKQTPELIAYAKARDIGVIMSSNLSLDLGDDYWERLVRSGLDVLIVPLDGTTPETYSKYRRRGSFEQVKANMLKIQTFKAALGLRTPRLTWQFLIFEHNEHEVEQVRRDYKAWGADEYIVGGAYMPAGAHSKGFAPSKLAQYNIYDSQHQHRQMSLQALLGGQACSWLYGVAVLNASGRIAPCCYTVAEKDDFGVYDPAEGFLKAWNAEPFQRARALGSEWLAGDTWEDVAHRVDGRGMGLSIPPGELVCQRCPVPFLRDVVDHELTFDNQELVRTIESSPDLSPDDRARLEGLVRALAEAKA